MNKKVLIDIDNTLTYIDYTLRSLEDYYKVDRKEVKDIYSFDLPGVYGISKENYPSFWEEREEDIVSNSVLNETVYKEILKKVSRRDDIYIVTARDPKLEKLTMKWLMKNDIRFNKLYCVGKSISKTEWSKKKGLVFDKVYEDNPVFLSELPYTTKKIVVDYPYNRNIIADKRLFP